MLGRLSHAGTGSIRRHRPRWPRPAALAWKLDGLHENWTVAGFVPNATGLHEAKQFGFSKDNLAVWDPTGKGVREVGEVIRRTTDAYMTARSVGVRRSRSLFALDTSGLAGAKT